MQNKRGQGLQTSTIILIILGVIVLVVLIIGFTIGWDKIAPWISTSNVDTIVTQCEVACSTSSVYDYCTRERVLKANDDTTGKDGLKKSCFILNRDYFNKYGIKACPALASQCSALQGGSPNVPPTSTTKKPCADATLGGTLSAIACNELTQTNVASQANDVTAALPYCCKANTGTGSPSTGG